MEQAFSFAEELSFLRKFLSPRSQADARARGETGTQTYTWTLTPEHQQWGCTSKLRGLTALWKTAALIFLPTSPRTMFPDLSFCYPSSVVSLPCTSSGTFLILYWASSDPWHSWKTFTLLSIKCSASSASWISSTQHQVSTRKRGSKAKKWILWHSWFELSL